MKSINFTKSTFRYLFIFMLSLIHLKSEASLIIADPSVFINEIHYDNSGADKNEFIEVMGLSNLLLDNWSIALYNGLNGKIYDTINLTGTFSDQVNGYGFLSFFHSGIQNGSPDGLALIDSTGVAKQFLSYEGSFIATDGAANGMTSTSMGIAEPPSSSEDYSLQLSGTGNKYQDFTWVHEQATVNSLNVGQRLTPVNTVNEPPFLLLIFFLVFIFKRYLGSVDLSF